MRSDTTEAPQSGGGALLVHGGAWAIPDDECAAHRDGLLQALDAGKKLLLAGAPAVEVVAETVAVLEAYGAFDAGCGAVLDRDGRAQLDAGVMDGRTLRWGAVANVRRLAQPIRVARRLLEGDGQARLLVGEGAEAFAAEAGFALVENEALASVRERARHRALAETPGFHTSRAISGAAPPEAPAGTVGCVARDRAGGLAGATSTGGVPHALPGRVGDSPMPGCGFYAEAGAAASATGWGEAIATVLLCGRLTAGVAGGRPVEDAAQEALNEMARQVENPHGEGAKGGLIVMDATGRGAWAFTTPRMARGGWRQGGAAWAAV